MYCSNCGNEVAEGSAFCGKCGAPIVRPSTHAADASGNQGDRGPQVPVVAATHVSAGMAPATQKPKKKKGGAGKVILALVVVLVLAGGGFFAYSMLGNSDDAPVPEAGPIDTDFWIGKWSGGLVSTETKQSKPQCYGGEAQDMTLDITGISGAGRVSMDATLLFHGHDPRELTADEQTVPGDSVETLTGVTATFDPSGFSTTVPMAGGEGEMEIEVRPVQGADSGIEVVVISKLKFAPAITDTYLLHKQ